MHPILDARAPTRGLDTHHHVPRPPPPPTRAPPPWTSRASSFVPSPPSRASTSLESRMHPILSCIHPCMHPFILFRTPCIHARLHATPEPSLSTLVRVSSSTTKTDKRSSSHTLDYVRERTSNHPRVRHIRTLVRTSSIDETTETTVHLNPLIPRSRPSHGRRLAISIEQSRVACVRGASTSRES